MSRRILRLLLPTLVAAPAQVSSWHTAAKVSAAVCPQLVGADMRALGQTPFLTHLRHRPPNLVVMHNAAFPTTV
jgi:hypothetical protein